MRIKVFGIVLFILLGTSGFAFQQNILPNPFKYPDEIEKWNEMAEEIRQLNFELNQIRKNEIQSDREEIVLDRISEIEIWQDEFVLKHNQPDTSAPNWKEINQNLAILVFTDEFGRDRGTVFVKVEEYWKAIALDGVSELGPMILPGN